MILKKPPLLFRVENSLGPLELEVIRIIWGSQKTNVRGVVNKLRQKRFVAYTTVMTVMNNLYKKGFLAREKVKKSYFYSPVVEENHVIRSSLSGVFKDLSASYGEGRILYSVFSTNIFPKINIATPVGYGVSLTLLLFLFGLSAHDLLQNFSFFGTNDYFNLLASDFTNSSDRLKLVVLALLESLPTINILTTAVSFILVVILAKKLSKLINFKTPSFTNLRSVI